MMVVYLKHYKYSHLFMIIYHLQDLSNYIILTSIFCAVNLRHTFVFIDPHGLAIQTSLISDKKYVRKNTERKRLGRMVTINAFIFHVFTTCIHFIRQ